MIQIVAGLHDERSIPALVGAISTGTMATDGLLQFGDKALGPVLGALNNRVVVTRAAAVDVAVLILKAKNDAASRAQIMAVIRSGIADSNRTVRLSTISTIEDLSREQQFRTQLPEFMAFLQNAAQRDPDSGVRNQAQQTADKIAKR
jgi:hypothetical protein